MWILGICVFVHAVVLLIYPLDFVTNSDLLAAAEASRSLHLSL